MGKESSMKLGREEKAILKSVERGEWRPLPKAELKRYRRYAQAALRKDKRINIRLPEQDLVLLQHRAVEEGLPYQTLISSVLHKYVSGRFLEKSIR
jgi:predicted DNA binding CopG/RHH family protein